MKRGERGSRSRTFIITGYGESSLFPANYPFRPDTWGHNFCAFFRHPWRHTLGSSPRLRHGVKTQVVGMKEHSQNSGDKENYRLAQLRYTVSNEPATWFGAGLACASRGQMLAIPSKFADAYDLRSYIAQEHLPADIYSGYWVGAIRNKKFDDNFYWENDQKVQEGFLNGEPSVKEENCLELKRDLDGRLGWNNLSCEELRRYICEDKSFADEERKSITNSKNNRYSFNSGDEQMKNSSTTQIPFPTTEKVLPDNRSRPSIHSIPTTTNHPTPTTKTSVTRILNFIKET